ncbi:protein TOXD [Cladorrhinum samala]|uniref:Protein TOXD n=1 Tax=Cladorrhinum samala TaxID=585594 RepID=A0AAV9HSD3_9PEZI|nr:protein TOXD [Cladorrhinum samala]
MASSTRTVIYLSPDGPVLRDISESYRPTGAQSLLRVDYSGINPADIKHAAIGLHSSVAGYDMSGEVLETGPDSPFQPGDRIFGLNPTGPGRPLHMGAHQDFAMASDRFWYKLPASPAAAGPRRLGPREAATLPVMTLTAADGLFHLLGLGFPRAGIAGSASQGLLIWGGASTVGVAALQLAKAAGHGPIFVTASAKNHAALAALGADRCFDYRSDDVVEQIRKAIRDGGKPVRHALDTVGAASLAAGDEFEKSSPALAAASIQEDQQDGPGVKLACVLPVREDPRFKLCFATRDPDSPLPMARMADAEAWYGMQAKVMSWVVGNFGEGQYVGCPNVTVVKGAAECLEAMRRSAEGRSSLEKIVCEHPL